jgi:hypothetical protein
MFAQRLGGESGATAAVRDGPCIFAQKYVNARNERIPVPIIAARDMLILLISCLSDSID